jgi:hypothetical protein
VAASAEFWAQMKNKVAACDADADPAFLQDLRRDLLENLLDIHVDFIRFYCDSAIPERATSHIEIIRKANINPAIKKKLVSKVFEVMTGDVAAAKENRAYDSALTSLQRFLELFPNHIISLRMMAEICKAWADGLSFKDEWDCIQSLADRAGKYMIILAEHPELKNDAEARPALVDLCTQLAMLASERGNLKLSLFDDKAINEEDRQDGYQAYETGIWWGRLGVKTGSADTDMKKLLANILNNYAVGYSREANEVSQTGLDARLKNQTFCRLFRKGVTMLEEAVQLDPGDTSFSDNLSSMKNILAQCEQPNLRNFFMGGNN